MVLLCPKCRNPNPDHARFCHFDGENLTAVQPKLPPTGPAPASPAPSRLGWLTAAVLACLAVTAAGWRNPWLAVTLAALALGWSAWRMARNRAAGQAGWWRSEGRAGRISLGLSAGSLIGTGLSFGLAAWPALGVAPPATVAPPAPVAVVVAGEHSGDARIAPALESRLVTHGKLPEHAPVPFCLMGTPLRVSSNTDSVGESAPAELAVDADPASAWQAISRDRDPWIEVGFEREVDIDGMVLLSGDGGNAAAIREVKLEFANGASQAVELPDLSRWQLVPLQPVSTDRVRLVCLSGHAGEGSGRGALREVWFCRRDALDPSAADWSGTWRTESFGDLAIVQQGNWLEGTYHNGIGVLLGRSTGRLVRGDWSWGEESGQVELQLSPDGQSFQGKWNSGLDGVWEDDSIWSGTKP